MQLLPIYELTKVIILAEFIASHKDKYQNVPKALDKLAKLDIIRNSNLLKEFKKVAKPDLVAVPVNELTNVRTVTITPSGI